MGCQRHAPATLPRERDSVRMVHEAGWDPVTVRTGAENLDPTGVQSSDRLVLIVIPDLFT